MSIHPKANLQLIYVSDVETSTSFYQKIFKAEPVCTSPRYVAFQVEGQALFALWSGGEAPRSEAPRFSEIGIMLPTGADIDALYKEWQEEGAVTIVTEPHDEGFGRAFLAKDPNGHRVHVCLLD